MSTGGNDWDWDHGTMDEQGNGPGGDGAAGS